MKEDKLTQDLEIAEEQSQDTGEELNEGELEAVAGGRIDPPGRKYLRP